MKVVYAILAVVSLANGVWMVAAPVHWYWNVPAAVPDTGPLNTHLVRDVGVVYMLSGLGLGWALRHLDRAYPVHLFVTGFYVGHALTHVDDIFFGRLPASHWWIDAPGVFLPAIALVVLALPSVWRRLTESARTLL